MSIFFDYKRDFLESKRSVFSWRKVSKFPVCGGIEFYVSVRDFAIEFISFNAGKYVRSLFPEREMVMKVNLNEEGSP
jgi:hypothetical protein